MAKQVFKGTVLTRTKVVNNIIKVYNDSRVEAQGNWYVEAHEFAVKLARKHNLTTLQVSGIIAAFSPLKSWEENKRIVKEFLATGVSYHTGAMTHKAEQILEYNGTLEREFILNTLNGNKIQRFFLNIAFPTVSDAVTIDRHAVCIALGEVVGDHMLRAITDKQYEFFQACYVRAGEKLGVMPHEVQAVSWVKWRLLKKINFFADVPF